VLAPDALRAAVTALAPVAAMSAPAPAANPDHPSFPSARTSQAVLRYSRRRVEALDLLSLTVAATRPVPVFDPAWPQRSGVAVRRTMRLRPSRGSSA
jgi:hypothetical protein